MKFEADAPVIGLVLQKSHLVTGDEGHYSGVVADLESRGAKVRRGGLQHCSAAAAWPRAWERGLRRRRAAPGLICIRAPGRSPASPHHTTSQVIPVFAGGLDFSAPVKKFFFDPLGSFRPFVDTVVSLTGFALVRRRLTSCQLPCCLPPATSG
jgi:magnesium chelatase subunit H